MTRCIALLNLPTFLLRSLTPSALKEAPLSLGISALVANRWESNCRRRGPALGRSDLRIPRHARYGRWSSDHLGGFLTTSDPSAVWTAAKTIKGTFFAFFQCPAGVVPFQSSNPKGGKGKPLSKPVFHG